MKLRKLSIFVVVLAVLTIFTSSIALAQDPDAGKEAWENSGCQKCHGTTGGGLWAGPLAGHSDHTVEEWISQVRNPRRFMPSFSAEQVSDQTITDMQAYMATLSEPADFSLPDVGLPDDAPEGQKLLVSKKCVACHGTTGPLDGFKARGDTPTAEGVVNQVRNPRKFMPAYSEGQVSDAEAALIADFLASQVSGSDTASEATAETTSEATTDAPTTLPQSGGSSLPLNLALSLLLGGTTLLVLGFGLKGYANRI